MHPTLPDVPIVKSSGGLESPGPNVMVNFTADNKSDVRWPQAAKDLVILNRNARSAEVLRLIDCLVEQFGRPRRACWELVHRLGVIALKPAAHQWSEAATELVLKYRNGSNAEVLRLIDRLVEESGLPRRACWGFAHRLGVPQIKPALYQWPVAAKELVLKYRNAHGVEVKELIDRLAQESGHPRRACRRFALRNGIGFPQSQDYEWSDEARELALKHRDASGSEVKELIDRLIEETGHPRRACRHFAKTLGIFRSRIVAYQWSDTARDLVLQQRHAHGDEFRILIDRLTEESGHPRQACLRFLHRLGIPRLRTETYQWSEAARELVEKNRQARGPDLARLLDRLVEESGHPRYACRAFAKKFRSHPTKRQALKWPRAARQLALKNRHVRGIELRQLISDLVKESGHSREACLRFAERFGVRRATKYRKWSDSEQQRLLRLLEERSVTEISRIIGRSIGAIRSMLGRIGVPARMGKDSFSKWALAKALHVHPRVIEQWIQKGLLKAQAHEAPKGSRVWTTILADDFVEFCKRHSKLVVGNRLSAERLEFVCTYVFPPNHAELLSVRESKKEREAYQAQKDAEDSEVEIDCYRNEDDGGTTGMSV